VPEEVCRMEKSENYMVQIARILQRTADDEEDDLRTEIKLLQADPNLYIGLDFQSYLSTYQERFMRDLDDLVWKNMIKALNFL